MRKLFILTTFVNFLYHTLITAYSSMLTYLKDNVTSQLILNLMFMGTCIVIIFYYINPNKMHMSQSLFYLTTALHVSGVPFTHLQEHKTTVTTASGNRYTVLLSAAIVEELELI